MTNEVVREAAAAAALAVVLLGWGCGKKGPPVAPLVLIPAAVEMISASRIGNEVFVTVTVPSTNIDASIPIDISRIDVYGYTGRVAPSSARWSEFGTVIATISVSAPPGGEADAPRPADVTLAGALPGTAVTVADTLTPDEMVQGAVAAVDPQSPEVAPLPLPGVPAPTVLRRFYLAIPFSQRDRPGPPGMQVSLVLTMLPGSPSEVRASYVPETVSLTWEPSGGLLGFLLDRPLVPEPLPFGTVQPPGQTSGPVLPQPEDASVPPGPTTYNVYRDSAPDPRVLPPSARLSSGLVAAPTPLNATPVATTSIADDVDFGRVRCYTVRAQRGAVMSEPSPPLCLKPIDVFPPVAPAGLAAVPFEGGISLIWEPNAELDLGGYLVLRRETGDATLRQLTDIPIAEASYRDTTVQTGTRYTYSVMAVDTQLPLPNVSAQSELVEETSR